ncbi:hypothetical protein ACFV0L_29745 [Streptosporangium canum]|uniref:hypothetical protein n=1 Tax=Streptosporangium canum TaxID=324952 RepID=UPI00368B2C82
MSGRLTAWISRTAMCRAANRPAERSRWQLGPGGRYGMPYPELLDGVGGPACDIIEPGGHRRCGDGIYSPGVFRSSHSR